MRSAVGVLLVTLALLPASAGAGQRAAIGSAPPAAAQATTERGRPVVRAVRLTAPIVLDGRLDESLYQQPPSAAGFTQQDPHEGEPSTEKTEVWVGYDDTSLYIGARLWETDPSRRVTSDMQRDASNLYNNDHFGVLLDPFHDGRNGYAFWVNAQGGMADAQITNESGDTDWNGLWFVKTADFDGGWTVEMQFPFRSLRFKEGGTEWGINFRRMVRAKNEISFFAFVPAAYGRGGLSKPSLAATLVGIRAPGRRQTLDVKPYILGSDLTNRAATPPISNQGDHQVGFDAKWGLTQSLVADFTYNTDFAQVEDDQQQVNLTRFSLFFPEKRDFFIEGQQVFAFGGAQTAIRSNANTTNNITATPNNTPILFFSRNIGLNNGSVVPIVAGGRLLGREGPYQIGLIDMRTDDGPSRSTDFSVLRLNRDILNRSRIGLIATRRAANGSGVDPGYTYGGDLNLTFFKNVEINAYVAKTDTPGKAGHDTSYKGRYEWNGDRWGIIAEHLFVDENFNPEVGFLRRDAFRRDLGVFRFSPRPRNWRGVRKLYYEASLDYATSPTGDLQTRDAKATYKMDFNNGDAWQVGVARSLENLDAPFAVARGVTVPVGSYTWQQVDSTYTFGPQRKISGTVKGTHGSFYDGTLNELTLKGRVAFSPQFYAEPTVSWNRVTRLGDTGSTNLVSSRLTYTLTPRMYVSALVQYQSSSDSVTTNARFRWEYLPGSELFVVYSDGRSTLTSGFPALQNRSFIVKATRLFRF